jgi:hypothetical protein
VILRTRYTVLLAALALFAISVLSDALLAQWKLITITDASLLVLVEDGVKWVGIVTWCAYHVWNASSFLAAAERGS